MFYIAVFPLFFEMVLRRFQMSWLEKVLLKVEALITTVKVQESHRKKSYPSFFWCLCSPYQHSIWASCMYLKIEIIVTNPLSLSSFPACKWNSLICSKDFFLVGSKYLAVVLHSLSTVPLLHWEGEKKMPFPLFCRTQKATVLRVPSTDSHVELNQHHSQSCAFITLLMHNQGCFGRIRCCVSHMWC